MVEQADSQHEAREQYRDASNLNARIQLHARFSTNPYGWFPWIFDQLELPSECRLLELGCGPGDLWDHNRDRIPATWTLLLSDYSPGMLFEARQSLRGVRQVAAFSVTDAQAIPFPAGSFDAVIANHMLYYMPDRAKALAEIFRVLRPGGRIYASTVGYSHMREHDDLVQRCAPDSHVLRWSLRPSDAFVLENGREQLVPWFEEISVRRYPDGLVVTEAAPLVAYLRSTRTYRTTEAALAACEIRVEQDLARRGVIRITKDSGLFAARKRAAPLW